MLKSDPSSYSDFFDSFGLSTVVWNYGKEIWCNLQGQFMHIVADTKSLPASSELSLCQLGVFGTKYTRA